MSSRRLLGHALLWLGFLSAVLATVSQKEIDLLPEAERIDLNSLNGKLAVPKTEFDELIIEPIGTQDSAGLKKSVQQLNDWQSRYDAILAESVDNDQKPPKLEHPVSKKDVISHRTAKLDTLWSTIRWPWYGASFLVGIVGVVLLRATSKAASQDMDRVQAQFSTLTTAMQNMLVRLEELNSKFDSMPLEEVAPFIDDQCVASFNEFADSRNALIQRFGMQGFADVMNEFAAGERYLNRAWCASVDGYVDEVRASIARSLSHLQKANQTIQDLTARN